VPSYQLNISLTDADIRSIQQLGRTIVLVKSTPSGSTEPQGPVAWVTIDADELNENNDIGWTTDYMVYESTVTPRSGATIKFSSVHSATAGQQQVFDKGVFTDEAATGVGQGSYKIVYGDGTKDELTFGLAQAASSESLSAVNGVPNPIDYITLGRTESLILTPVEEVSIFLQQDVTQGQIIGQITGVVLNVKFDTDTVRTVKYDSSKHQFIMA
jgi:hypothetical protein